MSKISAEHLARRACVYVRQSTADQVQNNLESKRRQYGLVDRARQLGWQDIEVIDEDLGCSGSGIQRPGFERLLGSLCEGKVGAVLSIEASRLARNGRDWHTLLEFCSLVGALLIDADGIYDPQQTNDRLLLGMKGTISEMELASFRQRAQAAIDQKAKRGELFKRVPVGYVRTDNDRVEKDPDERVRAAIDLVFRKFVELASVRGVYVWLRAQAIKLPAIVGAGSAQQLVWKAARYHALLSLLHNPMYAGAYVYGRTKTTARIEQGRKRVVRTKRARSEDWTVLLIDHHAGYIGWEDWQRNQAVIANNANAMADVVQGSVRRGGALLSGLLRCGHCGAKLVAQYPSSGVIRYQCNSRILDPDLPCCVMFGGLRADRMVAEQALQCLSPQAIQAAVQALGSLRSADDERIEQRRLALEHARYEASRARRQYDAVDPDNRLVAAELERRWNEALRAQTRLEEEMAALERQRPQPIGTATQREILALAEDLPRLWDHPRSLPEFKKRILRTVLKEIIVRSEGDTVHFVLHWQGGDHTELRMQKTRTAQHRYVNDADTIALIRSLARLQPDSMIASILNRMGRRTPHGQGWSAARVCATRGNHSIPVYRQGEGQARGELTVAEAATAIGVTPTTVLRLIRSKRLPATQICANAPWILRKDDVERFLATRDRGNPPQTLHIDQLALDIQ